MIDRVLVTSGVNFGLEWQPALPSSAFVATFAKRPRMEQDCSSSTPEALVLLVVSAEEESRIVVRAPPIDSASIFSDFHPISQHQRTAAEEGVADHISPDSNQLGVPVPP